MSIIIEVKNTKRKCTNCAKEATLEELQEGVFSDIGKGLTNMFTGQGGGFTKAIATSLQTAIIDAILEEVFDVAKDPDVKQTLIYKSSVRALGNIDLKDIKTLFSDKSRFCDLVTTNLIKSLIEVTTEEIGEEIAYAVGNKANDIGGGAMGKVLGGLTDLGMKSGVFLSRVALEDLKDDGAFQELSNAICAIRFTDVLKKIPGISSFMSEE
tara:strand:+ start:63 stop:695 length:633 start_codon:yes stop_codon:yes gene_type:complete